VLTVAGGNAIRDHSPDALPLAASAAGVLIADALVWLRTRARLRPYAIARAQLEVWFALTGVVIVGGSILRLFFGWQ
jgi:hypothetical protein